MKATTLVQQTIAAASSSITWGFNAGIELEVDATKSKSNVTQTTAKASTLSGNNININITQNTTVQGSNVLASEQLNIMAKQLAIESSQNTRQSANNVKHGNVTIFR